MKAGWMAALLIAASGLPIMAQTPTAAHFPLTADKIVRTLADRGMQIADGQVSMLANVVATEENPMLDVVSAEPLGVRLAQGRSEAHSLIKLACRMPGTCLPFYVIVNAQNTTASNAAVSSSAALAPLMASPKLNIPITMRAGTHATLIMDDNRAHIQVSVISLENGHTGDKIHVASPDRKQVYVAEVVGANLLKRSF